MPTGNPTRLPRDQRRNQDLKIGRGREGKFVYVYINITTTKYGTGGIIGKQFISY